MNETINNLKKPFYHFSVDDVFNALIEISDRKIDVFEHPFFAFLKELHDEFDTHIDLYVFFQRKINGKLRTLRDVSGSIKQELINNPWIRFGPHGLDYYTPPYTQTLEEQVIVLDNIYREIYRFAGKENLSKWVRLHNFSESYELKDYFHEKGVEAIFTTDREWITTRMPEATNESLKLTGFAEYNGLMLIRSHIRVENIVNGRTGGNLTKLIGSYLNTQNHLIFFTHDYELAREEVKEMTKKLLKELHSAGIPSL